MVDEVGAGGAAGEHLVQAGPEPEDVGPAVGVAAVHHLGGQGAVGAEDLPGAAGSSSVAALAIEKSATFTVPSSASRMLPGLRLPWQTPAWWA